MRFYTKKIFFLLTVISVCMLMCLNVHAKSEDFTVRAKAGEFDKISDIEYNELLAY